MTKVLIFNHKIISFPFAPDLLLYLAHTRSIEKLPSRNIKNFSIILETSFFFLFLISSASLNQYKIFLHTTISFSLYAYQILAHFVKIFIFHMCAFLASWMKSSKNLIRESEEKLIIAVCVTRSSSSVDWIYIPRNSV